jgi:hypothetical protein
MIESSRAIQTLRQYEGRENVTLARSGAALTLTLVRGPLSVVVTVPETVLEWFVDVVNEASGLQASDWWDYAGYDNSSREQLDLQMAADIAGFLESLLVRQLRLRPGKRPDRSVLEWLVEGEWRRAVPFKV